MRRLAVLVCLLVLALASPAGAARLRAGAGHADITPPQTGYYLGGWTRADRLAEGQSTRLYANALVLQRGQRKIALVAAELFAIPAGLQEDVARAVSDLGYDRTTVLLAASHTHSGPGGYSNDPTYNSAAPSAETITSPKTFTDFFLSPPPANPQLYTFLVHQIAQAIRRADADRAPAVAGWGHAQLAGLTQNRSLEAHLADHGIHLGYGQGRPSMDPDGPDHTIDPNVDVLRVDKVRHGRHVPIGAWSNFADHGTVVHAELRAYSGDHHAAAWRDFVARVRRAAHVPRSQTVVNVYPNSDEGDQTAGIVHVGPAAATYVGAREARAMFRAWRHAGRTLRRRPRLDLRWTRTCFCGRSTATGPVASKGVVGAGFLTGSEEGRGPLYDLTGQPFEGKTSPFSTPRQGDKIQVPAGSFPPAVPIGVYRIGDGAIAAVPGESTKQVGTEIRAHVAQALAPAGVRHVIIAGLANGYIQYITTPAEYGWQSYEGASTLYGPNEGTFFEEQLGALAGDLAAGRPAPAPYPFDPSYGVRPDGPPYPAGADHGTITGQPAAAVARLTRATVAWDGGPSGHDRPVDRAFVHAQRLVSARWRDVATDLGLEFLWRVDTHGRSTAEWEVPLSARTGTYRLRVTATRYALDSRPFQVVASHALRVQAVPGGVRLAYPPAVVDVDLTARPAAAHGGAVTYGGHTVRRRHAAVFPVPAGTAIAAGAARDRYGNTN